MAGTPLERLSDNSKQHIGFIAVLTISCVIFHRALGDLLQYALRDASNSHILLIPGIVIFLIYLERREIFAVSQTEFAWGGCLAAFAMALYWLAARASAIQKGNWPFCLEILAIVILWSAGFLLFYGFSAVRAAAFPLLFSLLMVPLPDALLDRMIYALQEGSTDLTYLIFQAVGTPVMRHGFLLSLPGVTIEVAKECSSIRSSIALLITCLLAAHMYLRTAWRVLFFILLALFVSVVKNAIRIATLTLLSIHVDPGFLTGRLHREGGFVFFLLAIAILFPVLLWLHKSENKRNQLTSVDGRTKAGPGLVSEL
jgi:exosortase